MTSCFDWKPPANTVQVAFVVFSIILSTISSAASQETITVNQLIAPVRAKESVEKAIAAISRHDLERASIEVDRALAFYPNYAAALTVRGFLDLRKGRSGEGVSELQHAIELDPTYGVPYLILASLRNDHEQFDEALSLLAKGMRLLPSAWMGHVEKSRALLGKGDATDALQEIVRAEVLAKDLDGVTRADIYYIKARVFAALGDFVSTDIELQRAVKSDPSGPVGKAASSELERARSVAKQQGTQ